MKAKQFCCSKLLSWGTFEGHYGLGLILWALITRITLAVGLWILSKVQLFIPSRPGDGLPRVRESSQEASATMPGLNRNGNIWCPVRQRWRFRGHFGRKKDFIASVLSKGSLRVLWANSAVCCMGMLWPYLWSLLECFSFQCKARHADIYRY